MEALVGAQLVAVTLWNWWTERKVEPFVAMVFRHQTSGSSPAC